MRLYQSNATRLSKYAVVDTTRSSHRALKARCSIFGVFGAKTVGSFVCIGLDYCGRVIVFARGE